MSACKQYGEEVYSDYNMVVLPNKLWLKIAVMDDLLCDLCIEGRLENHAGRELTLDDFPKGYVRVYKTQRLRTRTIPCNQMFFLPRGWITYEELSKNTRSAFK